MAEISSYNFMLTAFKNIIGARDYIDDFCFRLHHHYTGRMLVISLFISFLYKFLDPITCFTMYKDFPHKALDAYCLMQNTYTLPNAVDRQVGVEVAFQGVDNEDPDDTKEYQRYYQWVPIMLLVQAILFNLPYYLWETKERNNIKGLSLNLKNPLPVDEERVKELAIYLKNTRGKYYKIALWYLACSVLNLVNVSMQLVFTDMFLGGEFLESGWQLIGRVNEDYANRVDRMVTIFPRMTKCTFNHFGVGGDVQRYDAMCVMPFNFFYEWIFVFNITWFVFVTIVSIWYVICYMGSFASHNVQLFLEMLPCLCSSSTKLPELKDVFSQLDFGHRFVLIMLRSRLSLLHFQMLVKQLEVELKLKSAKNLNGSSSEEPEHEHLLKSVESKS